MTPLTVEDIAYHRNGIAGHGFFIVTFTHDHLPMVDIVFAEPGHCAVFNREQLVQGIIAFMANSWRGDVFEPALRAACAAYRFPHERAEEQRQSAKSEWD